MESVLKVVFLVVFLVSIILLRFGLSIVQKPESMKGSLQRVLINPHIAK